MVKIKVKKLDESAKLPTQANEGDAGWDIVSTERHTVLPFQTVKVKTGLAVEIPMGYEIQIRGKSGIALKQGLSIPQGIGTIDSGYRGELFVLLRNFDPWTKIVEKGQMVGQMVVQEVLSPEFEEVEELSESERGGKGFGSTEENI